MTLMWTVLSSDEVWAGYGARMEAPQEVQYGGYKMLVLPLGDGSARIERLLSLNPAHYLRPECQPGTRIRMPLSE